MKRHINFWLVMFLAISLALPIYSMAQTTLTLESYTTGDRISGGPIKSFSMGPDNNLVVYLDGPFNFADLVVPIWIQTSGTCSSTPPVPYPPPSVTAISNSDINFLVCSSPSATPSMVVNPEVGVATFTPAAGAGTFSWNTGGTPPVSTGSYLAVFQASDTATPPHTSQLVVMININPPETVSTPAVSGPATGTVNQSYTFTVTTPSTVTPSGDPVKYFFDWGDGTNSGWVSGTSAPHSWGNTGTYSVKVQAQCATHTSVVSAWSGTSSITISNVLTYTVTASYDSTKGTVSPASQTVNSGGTATFAVTPNAGYIASVSEGSLSGTTWTTAPVTSTHTATVTFTQSGGGGGSGSGTITNPYKINKTTTQVYNGYIPQNATDDSRGSITIPAGSKVYFEVDPVGTTGRSVSAFGVTIKFYAGSGAVCKLTQDKATGDYSSEVCAGYTAFMDIVYDGQPPIANKKFLYAVDNSGSTGAANDEMWAVIP